MKDIHIGMNISSKRKEKGITQEELADYLGVSKPAVSKWESGQSYPDITLLPVLASYFNLTVDELLGYEPQMTREDVRRLYHRMAAEFAAQPFEQVYSQCLDYQRKYFSCWLLQFHIGLLLVNHAQFCGSPERTKALYREALDIFIRVMQESDDPSLAKQGLHLVATCHLILEEPAAAIDLLEDAMELPLCSGVLLAQAYQMKGNQTRACALLQTAVYQNLTSILGAIPSLMALYADQPDKMEECYEKAMALGQLFGVQEMHPFAFANLYLAAVQLYTAQGNRESALDNLEIYISRLCRKDIFPLKLRGNSFFDSLDDYFNSLDLGTSPPTSSETILRNIRSSILENPALEPLKGEERFQRLVREMEQLNSHPVKE